MNSVIKVLEVDMVDLLPEYANPEDVLEWSWVESAARFPHVNNDVGPGVWEFMVHVKTAELVPNTLERVFCEAKARGCSWILFHQG